MSTQKLDYWSSPFHKQFRMQKKSKNKLRIEQYGTETKCKKFKSKKNQGEQIGTLIKNAKVRCQSTIPYKHSVLRLVTDPVKDGGLKQLKIQKHPNDIQKQLKKQTLSNSNRKYYSVVRKKDCPTFSNNFQHDNNKIKNVKRKQQPIKQQNRKRSKSKNNLDYHIIGVRINPDSISTQKKEENRGMSSLSKIILSEDISQIPISQQYNSFENSQQEYFNASSQTKLNDYKPIGVTNSFSLKKFSQQPTVVTECPSKLLSDQYTYQSIDHDNIPYSFKKIQQYHPMNYASKIDCNQTNQFEQSVNVSNQIPYQIRKIESQTSLNYKALKTDTDIQKNQCSISHIQYSKPNFIVNKLQSHKNQTNLMRKTKTGNVAISALLETQNQNLKRLRNSRPIIMH